MPNDYFNFKQFTIFQDKCAMKVGTDGVLLGAWTNVENATNILDIGTGTGLIAIMLAQRSGAMIDALEIDQNAAMQARENANRCPWNERIQIIHDSFQSYSSIDKKYDRIVSNPPYFIDSMKAPVKERSMARHNLELTHRELLEGVIHLLHSPGIFALILPVVEYKQFHLLANETGMHEVRKTTVYPAPGKKPVRIMAEFSFEKNDILSEDLIIEKHGRHDYSEEYKELTRDFYLNF